MFRFILFHLRCHISLGPPHPTPTAEPCSQVHIVIPGSRILVNGLTTWEDVNSSESNVGQASMPTMAPTYIKILINKNVHNSVPKPQRWSWNLWHCHQVKVIQTHVRKCSELLLWHVTCSSSTIKCFFIKFERDFRNYCHISTTSAMFYC